MQIKIVKGTALKGKGLVKPGDVLTEKDADPVELQRLVAYSKAVIIDAVKEEPKPKAAKEDKPKVDLTKGLTTKTAGAIK